MPDRRPGAMRRAGEVDLQDLSSVAASSPSPGVAAWMPALLTRMSRRPNAAAASATIAAAAAADPTSASTTRCGTAPKPYSADAARHSARAVLGFGLVAEMVERHGRAFGREAHGDRPADAAGPSGDEGGSIGETSHGGSRHRALLA